MNILRELLKKHDISQKQIAIELGVSNPTVSSWVHNKVDPSGKNLKKLAEIFGVDELEILCAGTAKPEKNSGLFVPVDPKTCGVSETQQVINYLLSKLNVPEQPSEPKTKEAQIVSSVIDKMSEMDREKALNMFKAVYAEYFEKNEDKMA